MKSSLSVDVSEDAQRDYRDILRYTRRTWGAHQGEKFGRQLVDAMQRLGQYPHLGESRDDLRSGMRTRPVGSHVIYYTVEAHVIIVHRL